MRVLMHGFRWGCALGAVVMGLGSVVWTWADDHRRVRMADELDLVGLSG